LVPFLRGTKSAQFCHRIGALRELLVDEQILYRLVAELPSCSAVGIRNIDGCFANAHGGAPSAPAVA
jgi:hypothetical protein